MKNGKERMNEILNKKKNGGLVWTTLVEDITLSGMPEPYRSMRHMDFYRHVKCDIFQFGDSGFTEEEKYTKPAILIRPEMEIITTTENDGQVNVETLKTQWGDIVSKNVHGHPIKYPVTNMKEFNTFKKLWQNSDFVEVPGARDSYSTALNIIGDDGILVEVLEASPVQYLLEYGMGVEYFYYLLADETHEVEEFLDILHEKRKKQYEIMAKNSQARAFLPIENTSTTYISPVLYEKYSVPQLKDYVDILHKYDKTAIIHMCGKVLHLLEQFKKIGADGIHALCEPTVGDTPFDEAFRVLGDDLIIVPLIDSAIFMDPAATKEDLIKIFEKQIRPNVYKKNVIFAAPADGMPMAYWKFEVLNEWIDKNI